MYKEESQEREIFHLIICSIRVSSLTLVYHKRALQRRDKNECMMCCVVWKYSLLPLFIWEETKANNTCRPKPYKQDVSHKQVKHSTPAIQVWNFSDDILKNCDPTWWSYARQVHTTPSRASIDSIHLPKPSTPLGKLPLARILSNP